MLFFISEEIANKAQNDDVEILDALHSLGYFWRTGCCLVDGSRASLEKLMNIDTLREYYSLILDQKQSVVSLYKEIDFFIFLCGDDSGTDKIIDGAVGKAVNINKFSNRIRFGLNIVLCENIRDYDFYLWGAKYFSEINRDVFQINILGYNGGGKMIVESARHILDYPGLVICDNDRKFPEDDEGSNIRELGILINQERPPFLWFYPIKVHEIENLIPYKLLHLTFGLKGTIKKMNDSRNHPSYGQFFGFFDFKEGFKKSTLRKMKKENVDSYDRYVSLLLSLGVEQSKINKALNEPFKKNESSLLSGIEGNILKDLLDYVNSNYIEQIEQDDHQKEDWKNIMRKIWSVGCASIPRRI